MEKAGLKMPDAPTWDFIARGRRQDDRPRQRHQRHLPARQGRLGREHGLPDRHVELLRRTLVRRELEAAVRPAGMEEHAAVLCRPDEGRRPAGRLLQRLQREPGAVPAGQVRHVDRRHRGGFLRVRPEELHRRRQGRLCAGARHRPRQARQLAVGLVAGHSRPARRRPTPPQKFVSWATSKDYLELVASKEGWANVPPGTRYLALRQSRIPEGGALRQDDAGLHQRGRPDQADRQAGALCRRAVRRHSRVPGSRHHCRPALLGGPCRPDDASTMR